MRLIMVIHVVQSGETVQSIAEYYGISDDSITQDNGLSSPYNLNVGQSLVIVKPEIIYTVQEGDTLENIADYYNISLIQLLS